MSFVYAGLIVASLLLFMFLLHEWFYGSLVAGVLCIVMTVAFLGWVIGATAKVEAKGPCHKYETQMMYNAATKTMMPSRVCVLRGEWVEETE
jgi:hypothetical protein